MLYLPGTSSLCIPRFLTHPLYSPLFPDWLPPSFKIRFKHYLLLEVVLCPILPQYFPIPLDHPTQIGDNLAPRLVQSHTASPGEKNEHTNPTSNMHFICVTSFYPRDNFVSFCFSRGSFQLWKNQKTDNR